MAESVLPSGAADIDNVTIESTAAQPSLTYRLDYENTGQVAGKCDELEAMKQAIYKIINTERYQYLIYSWNYGIELQDLIGQPIPYVYAELQRRITEALEQDDRILEVTNFNFSHNDEDVAVTLKVSTIYGKTTVEKVVPGIV